MCTRIGNISSNTTHYLVHLWGKEVTTTTSGAFLLIFLTLSSKSATFGTSARYASCPVNDSGCPAARSNANMAALMQHNLTQDQSDYSDLDEDDISYERSHFVPRTVFVHNVVSLLSVMYVLLTKPSTIFRLNMTTVKHQSWDTDWCALGWPAVADRYCRQHLVKGLFLPNLLLWDDHSQRVIGALWARARAVAGLVCPSLY